MNWLKILYEFERFVFQITVLAVLAPKTFIRISFDPRWVMNYLVSESRKDAEKRYDEYISPIIYWILFSVLMLAFHILLQEYIGALIGSIVGSSVTGESIKAPLWTDINYDGNRFAQTIIVSLSFPLSFTAVSVLWITRNISRSTMELPFYLQCYAFGTFSTIYTIISFVLILLDVGRVQIGNFPFNYIALVFAISWLFWFENIFLSHESVSKFRDRLLIILLSLLFGVLFVYLAVLVVLDVPNSILRGFGNG